MNSKVLSEKFFRRSTVTVARELIGKQLFRRKGNVTFSARIVETEAYLPSGDSACHAAVKQTARNKVMFADGGIAYVYAIHAKYCFNIVTEKEGLGCAVLIRAAEPISGIERMKLNRKNDSIHNLLSGPGKLCQAMQIDKTVNGSSLTKQSEIWFEDDGAELDSTLVKTTHRIGVTSAEDLQLRFVLSNSEFASGPKYMR